MYISFVVFQARTSYTRSLIERFEKFANEDKKPDHKSSPGRSDIHKAATPKKVAVVTPQVPVYMIIQNITFHLHTICFILKN